MNSQVINTIGIILTMGGAILIAVDVTRQYKGEKFSVSPGLVLSHYPITHGQKAEETEAFRKWQHMNFRLMAAGLICIIAGGIFQLIACWSYTILCRINQTIVIILLCIGRKLV